MTALKLIKGGRQPAERFERLVAPHYDALYRTAYRLTGSMHDAEDLVQELCVRAYRQLDRLAELDNPRAWLVCVLRRLFIDETRRYERSNVTSLESATENVLAQAGPGPSDRADAAIMSARLVRALARLDRSSVSLLILHDVEGYSLAELTRFTGLKNGTLKSRLHRARVKLGRLLNQDDAGSRTKTAPGATS